MCCGRRVLDKGDASAHAAVAKTYLSGSPIAIKGAEPDRCDGPAAVKRLAQTGKAFGSAMSFAREQIDHHRAQERRGTRRAAQLLENEQDLAQAAFFGI